MAKQVGPLFFTGTIDGVIFYKLGDQYYLRSKGDYRSGKQMRKDPRLKRTMLNADRFGVASKLVKFLYYRHVPKAVRKHGLFGKLTGMANRLLQEGKGKEEITEALIVYCRSLATPSKATETKPVITTSATVLPVQRTVTPNTTETELTRLVRNVKLARYLSRWKVGRNGRLHIPKTINKANPPTIVPRAFVIQSVGEGSQRHQPYT